MARKLKQLIQKESKNVLGGRKIILGGKGLLSAGCSRMLSTGERKSPPGREEDWRFNLHQERKVFFERKILQKEEKRGDSRSKKS